MMSEHRPALHVGGIYKPQNNVRRMFVPYKLRVYVRLSAQNTHTMSEIDKM